MKVVVTDKIAEKGIDKLKEAGFDVQVDTDANEDKVCELVKDADALIVRSGTQVTEKIINSAGKMKVIGRAGTGVDNIDVKTATAKGIKVLNTPFGNTISVAEHTIAMILSLCRHTHHSHESLEKGEWERKKFMGCELYQKTIGVIGLGKIGREVVKRLKGFEMNILGYDPFVPDEVYNELGIKKASLDEIMKQSDFITVHVSKNEKTTNLLGKKQFDEMKKGVKIINIARGGIVNEKELHDALKDGTVEGAALDVYEQEPPEFFDLIKLENVIATPHLGASTKEAQDRCGVQIAEQVIKALKENQFENVVN